MPISRVGAGLLGASQGINAMLRGRIRGEMARQQKEQQIAEFGQREQQLEIQRQQIQMKAQDSQMTPEEAIKQETWVRFRTDPNSLNRDDRIILGLEKARTPSTSSPTLLDLAYDAATGQNGMTPETFEKVRRYYASFKDVGATDQLFNQILERVQKTRDKAVPTGMMGNLQQYTVLKENISPVEQYQMAITTYKKLLPTLQYNGVVPDQEAIDNALGIGGPPQPGDASFSGPLTVDQELNLLRNDPDVLEVLRGGHGGDTGQ